MDDTENLKSLIKTKNEQLMKQQQHFSESALKIDKKQMGRSFSEKTLSKNPIELKSTKNHSFIQKNESKSSFKKQIEEETTIINREKKIDLIEREKKIRREIIEENNGWNAELETIVANIGEKCVGFKWMHDKCVSYYKFWYHFIGVISIFLSAAAGSSIITQVSSCSVDSSGQKAANWVIILVAVLMFLTSVISAILQFKNWGEVANQHQTTKTSYASLEHDIRIALGVYRKDRQIGKDFVEWISKEFDSIEGNSLPIPTRIQSQYQKLISGRDFAHNDTIEKIVIKNNEKDDNAESSPESESSRKQSSQESLDPINTPLNVSSNVPFVPLKPPTLFVDSIPRENGNTDQHIPQRKKSFVEIDVCEFESPFDNDRYKYEIKRFLDDNKK